MLKTLFKLIFQLILIGFITLLLLEFCYRNNIINFYKTEQLALNSKQDLDKKSADILVFGDSFSATSKAINYVSRLRELNNDKTILNFSIPGTGIRQINTFAASKIEAYKPKTIIYQIYVGNDLLDVEHFKTYKHVSLLKYLYWQTSNSFLSLSYLNHKSKLFSPRVNYRYRTIKVDTFKVEYYNKRSKSNLKINPFYLEETVSLTSSFSNKYKQWLDEINVFLKHVPKTTQVMFVWIPHCSQVNNYYLSNFKTLGANFSESNNLTSYPYLRQAEIDLKAFKNVKHLNVLPLLKQHDTLGSRVYFHNDPHLNKNGNDVLSKSINSFLSNL